MKRKDLEDEIALLKEDIKEKKQRLDELEELLVITIEQEKERKHYISSSEIVELINTHIGRRVNMSTIKRWADEGYLGKVIDEKDKFWALRSKQGKKRFLYPIVQTYNFLYEKGYLYPKYEILDRVKVIGEANEQVIGIVVDSTLKDAHFYYTIQEEKSQQLLTMIKEKNISKVI